MTDADQHLERRLGTVLRSLQSGEIALPDAVAGVRTAFFEDLEHSTLDHDRERRTGAAEVIYGLHKTPQQVADAFAGLVAAGHSALATRVSEAAAREVLARHPTASHHPEAALISLKQGPSQPAATSIAVVSAGTSDFAVAEEAARTAEFYDNPVIRVADVGVAGLHRLFARIAEIRSARAIIVIAGMEGALPSVIGGLVDKPVIAVPTSVGYGAAFDGVAALLGMLTSCASGVSVVNIDNGYGAGYLASMINRL
ncbi:MAG: nickel pincer cofactor biosynthesis protein LarB [Gammaproteobacteria bacterium]|nr:nickel pincer cofactor biosynthesis protein LarB [Gammaproteobacteria bacterium]